MCRNSSASPRGMSGLAALASAMAVFSSGVAARLVSSFWREEIKRMDLGIKGILDLTHNTIQSYLIFQIGNSKYIVMGPSKVSQHVIVGKILERSKRRTVYSLLPRQSPC